MTLPTPREATETLMRELRRYGTTLSVLSDYQRELVENALGSAFAARDRALLAGDEEAFRAMQKAVVDYWASTNRNKLIPVGELNGIICAALSALRRHREVEP